MTSTGVTEAAIALANGMALGLPIQGTPIGCFDTCWGATHQLRGALSRQGIEGRVVLLKGWLGRIDLPATGNHLEWQRMGAAAWTHWVVRIGEDLFIDPTARQFDADLGHPQIDDWAAISLRWTFVDGVRTRPEPAIVW